MFTKMDQQLKPWTVGIVHLEQPSHWFLNRVTNIHWSDSLGFRSLTQQHSASVLLKSCYRWFLFNEQTNMPQLLCVFSGGTQRIVNHLINEPIQCWHVMFTAIYSYRPLLGRDILMSVQPFHNSLSLYPSEFFPQGWDNLIESTWFVAKNAVREILDYEVDQHGRAMKLSRKPFKGRKHWSTVHAPCCRTSDAASNFWSMIALVIVPFSCMKSRLQMRSCCITCIWGTQYPSLWGDIYRPLVAPQSYHYGADTIIPLAWKKILLISRDAMQMVLYTKFNQVRH